MQDCDSSIIYQTWGNRAQAFQNIAICAAMNGNKAQSALFSMRAEMLASHSTEYPAYAANTDNALCRLLEKEPVATMVTGRKVQNLTEPDTEWGERLKGPLVKFQKGADDLKDCARATKKGLAELGFETELLPE